MTTYQTVTKHFLEALHQSWGVWETGWWWLTKRPKSSFPFIYPFKLSALDTLASQ